jgi:hypothetical protein|tara:strand:- start:2747 stop:3364 length:618 start_codon:yes stop_codon:yes gene_type:complete
MSSTDTGDFVHGGRERSFGKATGKMPDLSKAGRPRKNTEREAINFIGSLISPEKREALEALKEAKNRVDREKQKLKLIVDEEKDRDRRAKNCGFATYDDMAKDINDRREADELSKTIKRKLVESGARRRSGLSIKEYCSKHGITSTSREFKRRMGAEGFRDKWIDDGLWIVDDSVSLRDTRSIRSYEARGDTFSVEALRTKITSD